MLPFTVLGLTSCVKERPPADTEENNAQDIQKAGEFFNKLGIAAMAEENYAKAIANFRRAVQLNPYDPEYWKNLGEAYTAAKFFEKAREAFGKALALKPDYGEVYYDLGVLYTQWGKYGEAIKWFKKAAYLDTYEERYKAFYALAQLYKKLGKEKEYVANLQRAVDLYPRYKEALLELARYFASKGFYPKAELYYLRYLSAYPNDEKVTLEYARLLVKEGKYDRAKKILKSLIDGSQDPQIVAQAYKLVNQILIKEAQERLKKEKLKD